MADGQASGDILADGPEAFPHPLADRLKGLKAGATGGGVDTNAPRRAMVNSDEDGNLSASGQDGPRHIRTPHLVYGLRDDGSVVGARAMGRPSAGLSTRPFSRISRRTRAFEVRMPL